MSIAIFTGLPGSGKSYKLGQTVLDILHENKKRFEKQIDKYWTTKSLRVLKEPERRYLWTNLQLSPEIEKEYKGYIKYWTELRQLTPLRDADVVIDEIATYFDARLWETLSLELRRWLAQHRKFGIEIYGTAQDFAQTDKAFRRLTSDLLHLTKIIGSRDISATKPSPKYIWGFSLVQTLDPQRYDEEKSKFANNGIPKFMWIGKAGTDVFDTRAEVKLSSALPLKHIQKECEDLTCGYHKVIHV